MPRVLVTPTMLRHVEGDFFHLLREGGFEVIFPAAEEDTMQPATLRRLLEGTEAMLASTEPLGREFLARTGLRVVARMGVGYDSIDIPAATDLGIVVTTTPGTLEESVAEHTLALLLGVTRGIVSRHREVLAGVWSRQGLPRLAGRSFGLVGVGRIGRCVVPKMKAMGMRVLACDPALTPEQGAELGVELLPFEELLATADVVSLHLPCTEATRNLINARTLAQMKPGAVFLNTSRGGLVEENALAEALAAGRLLGAGLDVFQVEPLPVDSPLTRLPNVVLCTHMGGLDWESQRDAARLAAQCILDLHQGGWPEPCVVNKQLAGGWRW